MVHTTDIAELKQLGNAAHQAGDFRQALFFFSLALSVNKDPAHAHVLYSGRRLPWQATPPPLPATPSPGPGSYACSSAEWRRSTVQPRIAVLFLVALRCG